MKSGRPSRAVGHPDARRILWRLDGAASGQLHSQAAFSEGFRTTYAALFRLSYSATNAGAMRLTRSISIRPVRVRYDIAKS